MIDSLLKQLGKFENMPKKLPPVTDWAPPLNGVMDITVEINGDWVHEGSIIRREKLVRLFSTILRKEGGDYFLVTPIEKWQITVVNHPFIAVLTDVLNVHDSGGGPQIISLITNVGDEVEVGPSNPMILGEDSVPYVVIRSGLTAKISRSVYYSLADHAYEDVKGRFLVDSHHHSYQIG